MARFARYIVTVVVGSAALVAMGTASSAADNVHGGVFSKTVLSSDSFQALLTAHIEPEAVRILADLDLASAASPRSQPTGRIRHNYVPAPFGTYRTAPNTGPARPLNSSQTDVRVVYASYLKDAQPIDFYALATSR